MYKISLTRREEACAKLDVAAPAMISYGENLDNIHLLRSLYAIQSIGYSQAEGAPAAIIASPSWKSHSRSIQTIFFPLPCYLRKKKLPQGGILLFSQARGSRETAKKLALKDCQARVNSNLNLGSV